MTTKLLLLAAAAVAIALPTVSCKKNNTPAEEEGPACRITTITHSTPTATYTHNISYNSSGKPWQIISRSGTAIQSIRTITYGSRAVYSMVTGSTGVIYKRDSVYLDGNNRVMTIKTTLDSLISPDTFWITREIFYNFNGVPEREMMTTSQGFLQVMEYTVHNGDIVRQKTGADTFYRTYYTDKANQPGDYRNIVALLDIGTTDYLKGTHLAKSFTGNGVNVQMTYEMNTEGRITKLFYLDGATLSTYTYEYECD